MPIKISVFLAILLNLFLYNEAISGNYELLKNYPTGHHSQMFEIDESNLEVCKAYEKNLNSFPEIRSVMVCERPINPKLTDFKKPDWQKLNALDLKNVIMRIDKQTPYYKIHPNYFNEEKWEETFKTRIEEGTIKQRYAKLEIDNDKYKHLKSESLPLYILEYDFGGKCDPSNDRWLENSGGIEYFITTKDLKELVPIIGLGSLRGVFVYEGEVYFDALSYSWNEKLKKRRYEIWLHILSYRSGEFSRAAICRFRYIGKDPTMKSIR